MDSQQLFVCRYLTHYIKWQRSSKNLSLEMKKNNGLINVLSCSWWAVVHINEERVPTYFLQSLDYWDNIVPLLTGMTITEFYHRYIENKPLKNHKNIRIFQYLARSFQHFLRKIREKIKFW